MRLPGYRCGRGWVPSSVPGSPHADTRGSSACRTTYTCTSGSWNKQNHHLSNISVGDRTIIMFWPIFKYTCWWLTIFMFWPSIGLDLLQPQRALDMVCDCQIINMFKYVLVIEIIMYHFVCLFFRIYAYSILYQVKRIKKSLVYYQKSY